MCVGLVFCEGLLFVRAQYCGVGLVFCFGFVFRLFGLSIWCGLSHLCGLSLNVDIPQTGL